MKAKTKYEAFDGRDDFDTAEACREYERSISDKRLIGLTAEDLQAVYSGKDTETRDAIEAFGVRLARERVAAGKRKRQTAKAKAEAAAAVTTTRDPPAPPAAFPEDAPDRAAE